VNHIFGGRALISPQEALELVLSTTGKGEPERLSLEECGGLVCAVDIHAERAWPFFSFSAVDGYAVRVADITDASAGNPVSLTVSGEVRAAAGEKAMLSPGSAMRVMTGGALPDGAEAVVMREETREEKSSVTFFAPARPGQHINREGEELTAGTLLVKAGSILSPPAIGLLATLGHERIPVYPPPAVSVLTTGDELVPPGAQLSHGQIYDSIAPMLSAALRAAGVKKIETCRCTDDPETLIKSFSACLERSDIVLTVGGVSMGDYDHLGGVFERAGVKKVFWKVAQKPGKPLYFGHCDSKLVFGLPGNPAAALACFSLYALSAIRCFMGRSEPAPRWRQGVLIEGIENRETRVNFMRGDYTLNDRGEYELRRAGGQVSYMLGSYAASSVLLEIPAGPVRLESGACVRFLPHYWEDPLRG
jgi:molybdopterin molybdotransferase